MMAQQGFGPGSEQEPVEGALPCAVTPTESIYSKMSQTRWTADQE
jgi:hypothetical protein